MSKLFPLIRTNLMQLYRYYVTIMIPNVSLLKHFEHRTRIAKSAKTKGAEKVIIRSKRLLEVA